MTDLKDKKYNSEVKGWVEKMKGWVLVEGNKIVTTSNNSIEVFKTKEALFDDYGGSLGDLNAVKRVQVEVRR